MVAPSHQLVTQGHTRGEELEAEAELDAEEERELAEEEAAEAAHGVSSHMDTSG